MGRRGTSLLCSPDKKTFQQTNILHSKNQKNALFYKKKRFQNSQTKKRFFKTANFKKCRFQKRSKTLFKIQNAFFKFSNFKIPNLKVLKLQNPESQSSQTSKNAFSAKIHGKRFIFFKKAFSKCRSKPFFKRECLSINRKKWFFLKDRVL